uniref:Pre-mRNA polyadenylation factor Fip1 domain-containing protein n=1 Tax=Knipowitschia caucasica TaxID=637954 RepID=A0AAV2KY85_KNICA
MTAASRAETGRVVQRDMDDIAKECGQEKEATILKDIEECRKRDTDITESPVGKPWRNPGANITDYFNYGFTEESWEAYCKKRKEMKKAIKKMVDRDRRNQEKHNRPSTASDICRLFPSSRHDSRKSSNQDLRINQSRKASSSAEDRATRLFPSLGSMCPPDLYSRRPALRPLESVNSRVRSRHRMESREEQHKENEQRRRNYKATTSSNTGHKKVRRDKERDRRIRKETRDGTKGRRQSRRHPLP